MLMLEDEGAPRLLSCPSPQLPRCVNTCITLPHQQS